MKVGGCAIRGVRKKGEQSAGGGGLARAANRGSNLNLIPPSLIESADCTEGGESFASLPLCRMASIEKGVTVLSCDMSPLTATRSSSNTCACVPSDLRPFYDCEAIDQLFMTSSFESKATVVVRDK